MKTSGHGWARLLLVAATISASGCYESEFPLDPVPRIEIDSGLLGTWRCLPSFDPEVDDQAATVVVARGRDRMYAVTFQETGKDLERYEAFASSVAGVVLLNVRDLSAAGVQPKPWVFLRYSFLRPKVLQVQIVDRDVLKGVEPSLASVRRALARHRKAPDTYMDFMVCLRAKSNP